MLGDLLKTPSNRELYENQGMEIGDEDVLNLELGIDEVLRAKLEQEHKDRFYNGPKLSLQMLAELDEEDWEELEESYEQDYGFDNINMEDRTVQKMLKFNNPDTFEEFQDLDDAEKKDLRFDNEREEDLAMILEPEKINSCVELDWEESENEKWQGEVEEDSEEETSSNSDDIFDDEYVDSELEVEYTKFKHSDRKGSQKEVEDQAEKKKQEKKPVKLTKQELDQRMKEIDAELEEARNLMCN